MDHKEIAILGGTGSLGKTLTRKLFEKFNPKGVRIFSRDEFKQWEMRKEFGTDRISYLIGDIRDRARLKMALHGVDIVFNAAAMKQVPACEENPEEAVNTNIKGAINILRTAITNNVKLVMHVSTDKAVYPVNLYGKTKAVAEDLFLYGNIYTGGRKPLFSCCRYGNVLGSRGSIIPLFREQIKSGRVTVTDKRMTRFWITLDRVADFIIEAAQTTKGNEIFIPKMPSMKIIDLIEAMAPGIQTEEIGIRKGEKLHECLVTEEESVLTEEFPNSYVIRKWQEEQNAGRFTYCSNNNTEWLSKDDLRGLLNV